MSWPPEFRLAKIPVKVDPSLFLVLALFGYGTEEGWYLLSWVLVGVASVLLHEMGHALTFRRYGQTPRVLLYAMGGLTIGEANLTPRRQLAVSLAGPGAELVVLGLPALAIWQSELWVGAPAREVLAQVLWINIAWPIFNLLPVLPLDGGHALASVVSMVSSRDGMAVAQRVSIVVAGTAIAVGMLANAFVLVIYGGLLLAVNLSAARRDAPGAPQDARSSVSPGMQALLAGDVGAARLLAERIGSNAPALLRTEAAELRAWSLLLDGDVARAKRSLQAFPASAGPSAALRAALAEAEGDAASARSLLAWSLLHEPDLARQLLAVSSVPSDADAGPLAAELCTIDGGQIAARRLQYALHVRGRYAAAAKAGVAVYAASPRDPIVAFNVACSAARSSELDVAAAWLQRALDDGWTDRARLEGDPDLAGLRDTPAFASRFGHGPSGIGAGGGVSPDA